MTTIPHALGPLRQLHCAASAGPVAVQASNVPGYGRTVEVAMPSGDAYSFSVEEALALASLLTGAATTMGQRTP